MHRNAPGVRF